MVLAAWICSTILDPSHHLFSAHAFLLLLNVLMLLDINMYNIYPSIYERLQEGSYRLLGRASQPFFDISGSCIQMYFPFCY